MAKKKRVYTSGTMYEQETGRYMTPGMDAMESKNGPASHKKKVGPGKVTVARGKKDEQASAWKEISPGRSVRGVGDDLPDNEAWWKDLGEKRARKKAQQNKLKPPRRR